MRKISETELRNILGGILFPAADSDDLLKQPVRRSSHKSRPESEDYILVRDEQAAAGTDNH